MVMKGRNLSMKVKRSLKNSIVLPTFTYGSETWTWNRAKESRVLTMEMNFLRGGHVECQVSVSESNESILEIWHGCMYKWSEVQSGGIGEKEHRKMGLVTLKG